MLSPRATEIADAAEALLDEEGPDALTMRRLGDRLGIKAASIYKHLAGKDELEAELISRGFADQAEAFERAFESAPAGGELEAIADAYRSFARERPHRYRLMTERELRRELLRPGVEERAAAPLVGIFGGDRDRARAAWAFAHGMTILELDRRFPGDADLDAAWRTGLAALAP
jgi:AcrR family transcriptional regulator